MTANAQDAEYLFNVPVSENLKDPYTVGIHSGARDVYGPVDLDDDGQEEIVVADYSGGGRAHVIENVGEDTWEWVYSTPWLDSTATTENARAVAAGNLDNDQYGEIIFFGGQGYAEDSELPIGLYAFEFNGTDFGTEPTSIYEFGDHLPDRWRVERIEIDDIDGDATNEIMFGNNGAANEHDTWYIVSVTGDIGGGFEVWVEEARLSSRVTEPYDEVNRGGGSPYYLGSGDFNGDGTVDLTLHSWNSFNLTTGQVTGPNLYDFPEEGAQNAYIHVTESDYVALFGGTVIDIDQDGNDEVFYPVYSSGSSVLLNYDEGENTLEITEDNVVQNIFGEDTFSSLGIGSGDLDGDGRMEVFGTGASFTGEAYKGGNLPAYLRIAEYQGGDVEDPANYSLDDVTYYEPFDTTAFNVINRDDTTYFEDGIQGPVFISKFAYLGDPDGDDYNELAVSFQGIDDSTFVIEETLQTDPDTTLRDTVEAVVNENRVFMRVLEGSGLSVDVEDEVVILPQDYTLSDNYPNPFNPSTSFSYTLPLDKSVSVKVYDIAGREVKTLVANEFRAAGTYEVTWDGTNNAGASVASGTYIYSLEWGQFRKSKKMVLIK